MKRACQVWLAAAVMVLGGSVWAAGEEADATLQSAKQFLTPAFKEAKETALSSTRDTSAIITALRSARDKDLVPLFDYLRTCKPAENQVYGMVSAAVIAKDSAKIDIPMLLGTRDASLIGSAIAALIDTDVITNEQLQKIVDTASDYVHKAMAAGELNHRGALKDQGTLTMLLNSDRDVVRFYAAISILETATVASTQPGGGKADSGATAAALGALHELSQSHDLRVAPVEALMIVRAQKQNISAAIPWIADIASDEANDEGLRYTALGALMELKSPKGPEILGKIIGTDKKPIQQIELSLIALECADKLASGDIDTLQKSQSSLAKSVAELDREQAAHKNAEVTAGVVKLIQEGQPVILNWALLYSDRTDADRALAIREALIKQATIVDDNRGADYERAALAAQKAVEGSDEGRRLVGAMLKSENKAVVEACLAGIYRAEVSDQSALVMPVYDKLIKASHSETLANYAALILAREGHVEALSWLPNMVTGSTVQNPGFRALAGWYYAKLKNEGPAFLKDVLAAAGK